MTIELTLGNCWTDVRTDAGERWAWLAAFLSVEEPVYRAGQWGGSQQCTVLDYERSRFPTGLAGMVRREAIATGRDIRVQDARTKPCEPDLTALPEMLRDYQRDALTAFLKAGRGIINAPTGAGKGHIAVAVTQCVPCTWLFVCHRSDVVDMIANRYQAITGDKPGVWASGRATSTRSNLYVSTFQALYRALKKGDHNVAAFLERIGGVIVDEIHSQSANSFYKVSMSMTGAYYRLGLSGTPLERKPFDTMRMIGAVGPVVYKIKTSTLVDAGVLAKPTVRVIPYHHNLGEAAKGWTWRQTYDKAIVDSMGRNALVAEMALRAPKPCLVFVDETDHIKALKPRIEALGLSVGAAHGQHDTSQRSREIARLVDGSIDVLICTSIFQEGVDIPSLASVVMAAGKSSAVGAVQRMGRGMRVDAASGKTTFTLLDVGDAGNGWLAKHAKARVAAYSKQGHEIHYGWEDSPTEETP